MRIIVTIMIAVSFLSACRSTKSMSSAIAPRDTSHVKLNQSNDDSIRSVKEDLNAFRKNHIDFRTFSAKIKVDVEDSKGKQPDLTAVVRMIKDSSVWISLSATFLNIEVYRILIEKNKVILINKQDKEVQFRTIDYLQEVTQIPFDFATVQDLLIGNPVFFNDSISSYRKNDNYISILSIGEFFKHLLTITPDSRLLVHSKLDDVDMYRNRTADISYGDYEMTGTINFPTSRHIVIAEKTKMDIRMRFKQVEFNKDLSVAFSVPKGYKTK